MSFGFGKNSGPTIPTSGTPSFGFFPLPPSSTPSAPFPDSEFSAGPSPRTFDAQAGARPHSFLDSTSPLKSSSQLHDAQIRAPFLHKGEMQNPVTRDFGSNRQKRSFGSTPQYLGAGMSSKVPQFQNSESSRSPPIQYNEDFMRDPGDDIMEQTTTFSEAWNVPGVPGSRDTSSQNERSISHAETVNVGNSKEFSPVDEFQRSSYNHRDASKRPSISHPKSRIETGGVRIPGSLRNSRLSPSDDGMIDSTFTTRPVNHSVSKRTRSPTSSVGQVIQMSSNSAEDDTDRV